MGFRLKRYEKKHWQGVIGVKINPLEKGEFFLHLVPPLYSFRGHAPAVLFINGEKRVPISEENGVLLTEFLMVLQEQKLSLTRKEELERVAFLAAGRMKKILKKNTEELQNRIYTIVQQITKIAGGEKEPKETLDYAMYRPFMRAPYRAVLQLDKTLSNGQWKQVMDRLVEAGVVKLVLTGVSKETERTDLLDLLYFETTVSVEQAKGEMELMTPFDVLINPKGQMISFDTGESIGSVLEYPVWQLWQQV